MAPLKSNLRSALTGFAFTALPVLQAFAQPTSRDMQDSATFSIPKYLTIESFKITGQRRVELGPNLLEAIVNTSVETVPGYQTSFELGIKATEDLFTKAGPSCGIQLLKKSFSAGQTETLSGIATSHQVGEVWIPIVPPFNPNLLGEPRSDFAPNAVIAGTDDAKTKLAEACGAQEKEQKAIRDTILGTWKGHYVGCPNATLESEEVVIELDQMNDPDDISGTETWPHITPTSSCKRLLTGKYTALNKTLTLTPGEVPDPSPVCLPGRARPFASTIEPNQKKATFQIARPANCSVIHVEKQ